MGSSIRRPGTVLMTADTVGGVWTYSLELARAFAADGVRVILAALDRAPTAEQQTAAREVSGLVVEAGRYRLPWMADPWHDMGLAGAWLLELERRYRPDVVHLSEAVFAELPWHAPTVAVGHSCVLSWWQAVRGEPAPAEWDEYRARMRAGFAAADAVVAPSSAMLDALRFYYGVSDGCVIPNGRDPARYRPGDKEAVILAAGRLWDQAKNIGALATAAERLPWPIYVAGEEHHPDGGPDAGLSDALRPLGRLSEGELADWLSRAGVYAAPARYEPFGLGPLEAGLAGCALVLGDIPSLREVWGDTALFVAPDDARALERALGGLVAYPEYRRAMAARARTRALTYTPRRMADGYLQLYAALLSGAGTRPIEEPACAS